MGDEAKDVGSLVTTGVGGAENISKVTGNSDFGTAGKVVGAVDVGTNLWNAHENYQQGNNVDAALDAGSAGAGAAGLLVANPYAAAGLFITSAGLQAYKKHLQEQREIQDQKQRELEHKKWLEQWEPTYLKFQDSELGRIYNEDLYKILEIQDSKKYNEKLKELNENLEKGVYGKADEIKTDWSKYEQDDPWYKEWWQQIKEFFGGSSDDNNANSNEPKSDWKEFLDPDLKEQAIYDEQNGYHTKEDLLRQQVERNKEKQDPKAQDGQGKDTPNDNPEKQPTEPNGQGETDPTGSGNGENDNPNNPNGNPEPLQVPGAGGGFGAGLGNGNGAGTKDLGDPKTPFYDPLLIALQTGGNNTSISVVSHNEENGGKMLDLNGDGIANNVSWIGKDTGVLFYDENNNGKFDGIACNDKLYFQAA